MAKSRAQRKAEAEKRRKQGLPPRADDPTPSDSQSQHDTQVPESYEVMDAELAMEHGAAEADRVTDAVVRWAKFPERNRQGIIETLQRLKQAAEADALKEVDPLG